MIGFDSDLTIRREIDRVLQLHHAEVQRDDGVRQHRNDQAGHRDRRRRGAACPSRPCCARSQAGTLVAVPLATDELVRPLGIIHRRGKELGSTARRFIELLQSEGQTRRAGRTGRDAAAEVATASNGQRARRRNGNGATRSGRTATAATAHRECATASNARCDASMPSRWRKCTSACRPVKRNE